MAKALVPKHSAGSVLNCKNRNSGNGRQEGIGKSVGNAVVGGITVGAMCVSVDLYVALLERRDGRCQCLYDRRCGNSVQTWSNDSRDRIDTIAEKVPDRGPIVPDAVDDVLFAECKELWVMLSSKSL